MDGTTTSVVVEPTECQATIELTAPPERVFRALASKEVTDWWVRPGVFDTREWTGEVRTGGHWQASGVGRGRPYTLEGEFLEVDPPRKLVHTWHLAGTPASASTVNEVSTANAIGWETSFQRLAEIV